MAGTDALYFVCPTCGMRNHVSLLRLEYDHRYPVSCHHCGHRPDRSALKAVGDGQSTPVHRLIGEEVIVRANGIRYEGLLVEVTDGHLALRGLLRYIEVPMERVTGVEAMPRRASQRRRATAKDRATENAEEAEDRSNRRRHNGISDISGKNQPDRH